MSKSLQPFTADDKVRVDAIAEQLDDLMYELAVMATTRFGVDMNLKVARVEARNLALMNDFKETDAYWAFRHHEIEREFHSAAQSA